ncbi:MAG: Thiamine phosphate synthase [uncultured Campylobacterales bacterium]|uniref:Thiamine phosphate synthase n=1 Tax=uncultured Campylobacterales bacterium TaxID=352960 RepID=A0A6S6SB83_9BACT|nr:MAG: Thiamine phosphate synthase [uncultured Campylobacterales bacterium]
MKSYFITDLLVPNVSKYLKEVYKKYSPDFVCYRDKSGNSDFMKKAEIFLQTSKEYGIKNIYLNSNFKLASSLGYDGVHLTSFQIDLIDKVKKIKLKVIVSTHNENEIKRSKEADFITYSPVFKTPNKGVSKGIIDLKEIVLKYKDVKIFALGGIISPIHIEQIKSTNAYGFASIRYFQ